MNIIYLYLFYLKVKPVLEFHDNFYANHWLTNFIKPFSSQESGFKRLLLYKSRLQYLMHPTGSANRQDLCVFFHCLIIL